MSFFKVFRNFSHCKIGNAWSYSCIRYFNETVDLLQSETSQLHIPVMLHEVIQQLQLKTDSIVLDMTFGAGGHSKAILERYPFTHIIALDRDEVAFARAKKYSEEYCGRVTPLLGCFSEVEKLIENTSFKFTEIDAVLIDSGCSSMQFDDGARGFSISRNGPLDMRMDGKRHSGQPTAADVINTLSKNDIAAILLKYGEETYADEIASNIVKNRPIYTTSHLAKVVGNTFSNGAHMIRTNALGKRCHAATKTFMALRIFVNDEINELMAGLKAAEALLAHGGRLAVLTFHSLEDRVVKRQLKHIDFARPFNLTLKQVKRRGVTADATGNAARCKRWIVEKKHVVRPSEEEVARNHRSRSAKLRVAVRNRSDSNLIS